MSGPRGYHCAIADSEPKGARGGKQMAVQNIPRPEQEVVRESLVGAAAAVLGARRRDIPGDFVLELFARTAPDDLERCNPEQLAGIAEQSWSFLLQRPPAVPKIAFTPSPSGIAVLDIAN